MFWSFIVMWLKVDLFLFFLLGFQWAFSLVSVFNSGKFLTIIMMPLCYPYFLFLELLLGKCCKLFFIFHISFISSLSLALHLAFWVISSLRDLIEWNLSFNSVILPSVVLSLSVCISWSFLYFSIFYKLTLLRYNIHAISTHLNVWFDDKCTYLCNDKCIYSCNDHVN